MGWMDGEGLVHATRARDKTKGIKLKNQKKRGKNRRKEPRTKEGETEDLREGRAPRNIERKPRGSCATFEGIDQSCIVARKQFVE